MNPTEQSHDDDDDHHGGKLSDDHDDSRDNRDHDPIELSNDNKENDVDEEEDEDDEHDDVEIMEEHITSPNARKKNSYNNGRAESDLLRFADSIRVEEAVVTDPEILAQIELIETTAPKTELEIALSNAIKRKTIHLNRVTAEIVKLKNFISKRKQTYKRKRKDDGAPTRALSAYNIFIQERFALLAKENEKALMSENEDITLKRVPPAHLVAATGNVWKTLSLEEKQKYEERYVISQLGKSYFSPESASFLTFVVSLRLCSAKGDRKRYETQMAEYQPPDKQANRKRNKTGYNMFFSSHVLRLKQTDSGVPSERGSVARLVGSAWKLLAPEEKAYYESEADKHNGMNPVKPEDDEEDDVDDVMKSRQQQHHMEYPMPGPPHPNYNDMHMHVGMAPPPPSIHPALAQQHMPDAAMRHHHNPYYPPPPPHMYAHAPPPPHPPYGHYDYSQHHQRHQARAQGGGYQQQGYQPGASRRPYE